MKNLDVIRIRDRGLPRVTSRTGVKSHHVTVELISPNGIVTKTVEEHNTFLNQGLDRFAERNAWLLATYCVLGEGVDTDDVEDVGMASEAVRTNTEVSGGDSGFYRPNDGHHRVTRHMQFSPQQVEGLNVTTIGFSHVSSAGNNLNVKTVLPQVITVPAGFYLRVLYSYDVILTGLLQPFEININGLGIIEGNTMISGGGLWPSASNAPNFQYSRDFHGFSKVAQGLQVDSSASGVHGTSVDFSSVPYDVNNVSLPNDGSRQYSDLIFGAYSPGSFEREVTFELGLDTGNTELKSISSGAFFSSSSNTWYPWFVLNFPNTPVTKDNEHILKLDPIVFSWGRE